MERGMEVQVQRDARAAVESADQALSSSDSDTGTRPSRGGEWSESALRVLNERYLMKREGKVVETPDEMCWRVSRAVAVAEARWGGQDKVQRFERAFYDILIDRKFMPNSPTLMNAG